MRDVQRVVDAEADYDHDTDADDGVYGEAPEMQHADDVDKDEYDAGEYHEREAEVGQHDEADEEDAGEGERQVAGELVADDVVCLPRRVDHGVDKRVGEVRLGDEAVNGALGCRLLARGVELAERETAEVGGLKNGMLYYVLLVTNVFSNVITFMLGASEPQKSSSPKLTLTLFFAPSGL